MRNFYEETDAGLATGAAHFATVVTSSTMASYGLLASDLASFTAANAAYQAAYAAAINPTTRTTSAVSAKQDARRALVNAARGVALKINGTRTVTDAMKIDAGLKPRALPTPIQPITVKPTLEILSVDDKKVRVNVRQPDKSKRGKLPGAYGIQVLSYVGLQPENDLSLWKVEGNATVTKVDIEFPASLPAFTRVWLTACWITPRLQAGPGSTPISINLGTFVVQGEEPQSSKPTVKLAA